MTRLEEVASKVAELGIQAFPPSVLAIVKASFLDCLGVTIAARDSLPGRLLMNYLGSRIGSGQASIIGTGVRTAGEWAAWANGTLAHALDLDDTSWPMVGHPTAPVLPAVLAIAEETGQPGQRVLLALTVGIEFELYLGKWMAVPHYQQGWHPTATLGTLGAAVAAAKMLSLDATQTAMAIAIAVSNASGLYCNAGTMTKPLHAGNAARNGLLAAELAARGFTGSLNAFDSPMGFIDVFSHGEARGETLRMEAFAEELILAKSGPAYKLYPCCSDTHRAIDAMLKLRARWNLCPSDIRQIHCLGSSLQKYSLPYTTPRDCLEAKFSMPYCLAAALFYGDVSIEHFDLEKGPDRRLIEFCNRITFSIDPNQEKTDRYADEIDGEFQEVKVVTNDGNEFCQRVYHPRGHPRHPLTWDELAGKFRKCVNGWLTESEADSVVAKVEKLETLETIEPIMALVRGRL